MSVSDVLAMSRRRRALMANAAEEQGPPFAWPPLGDPAAVFDITAVLNGTLDEKYYECFDQFLTLNDMGEEAVAVMDTFFDQDNNKITCLYFTENAFITFVNAQYEAEAIEAECYLPEYGEGMILICGNGEDNLIAVQLYVESDGTLYVKTFQEEETADYESYGIVEVEPLCRVTLRLERCGNRGRVSVRRGGGDLTAAPLFETTVAGTSPEAFDSVLENFGFGSGIVMMNEATRLVKFAWWLL